MASKPRRRLTRAESKARTRELLLEAAERVFAKQGFFATSVEEIAEEAGFSKGALYSNFGSKEELFLNLVERYVTARTTHMEAVASEFSDSDGAHSERVGEAFEEILDEERPLLVLMLEFWAYAARNPDVQRQYAKAYRRMRTAVASLIERRAAAQGIELPLPPDVLAAAAFAIGNGVALERLAGPPSVTDGLFGVMLARLFAPASADGATESLAGFS